MTDEVNLNGNFTMRVKGTNLPCPLQLSGNESEAPIPAFLARDDGHPSGSRAHATPTFDRREAKASEPKSAVWLVSGLNEASLARIVRGREQSVPWAQANIVAYSPLDEITRDGVTGRAFHVFLTDALMQEVTDEVSNGGDAAVVSALCAHDQVLQPLLFLIKQGLEDPSAEARVKVAHLTRAAAEHILSCDRSTVVSQTAPELAPRQMRALREHIEQNLAAEILIGELASLVGVSRTQFLRRFKATTGTSPYQWVMRTRVEKAKELLMRTRLNMTEIAAACGFASQAHLSTVFQRFVKLSPTAFRKGF